MKTYGSIKYSTVDAPQPIAGICENFNYKIGDQVYEVMGESDLAALVMHGRKGTLSFSSTPPGSATALGVRAAAELTVTGVTGGKVLVMQSSAKWQRGQAMVFDAQANHYPSLAGTAEGTITPATITLLRGASVALQLPTASVWFGVEGLTPVVAEAIVQSCSITESVQAQEEEDAIGDIVAVALHSYKATAQMEVLTDGAIPEIGSDLEAFGTFRILNAEEKWAKGSTRSIMVDGIIVPA